MSGITERVLVLGKSKSAQKVERIVPFPWDYVNSSVGGGWEPVEWQPMGRVNDADRLWKHKYCDVMYCGTASRESNEPYFYDKGTLIHGGFVQTV